MVQPQPRGCVVAARAYNSVRVSISRPLGNGSFRKLLMAAGMTDLLWEGADIVKLLEAEDANNQKVGAVNKEGHEGCLERELVSS